jgi:hypothetical protein
MRDQISDRSLYVCCENPLNGRHGEKAMGKESALCTYPMQIVHHLRLATVSQSCLQLFLPLNYGMHLQSIDVAVSSRG